MAVKPGLQTIEDLLALPDDGKRYELDNGVIVEVGTSSFQHALLARLSPFLRKKGKGRVS
ncbi:MAG: hypothetical protein ACYDBJ_12665 [Aggregatilineales bacterium]